MASAKAAFLTQSQAMACAHSDLMEQLRHLENALDAIECYSEVYANLASSSEVVNTGRWLAGWLPEHFAQEESTVLASIAAMGPELAKFAGEMRRQHQEIGARLEAFCKVANQLTDSPDLQQSICDLKDQGKSLTTFMTAHMGAEERKFATVA